MKQKISLPQIEFPRAYVEVYDSGWYGQFGDYKIYDINQKLGSGYGQPYLKDLSFGPFVDFGKLKGCTIRMVDDFFVACNQDKNTITIYDRNVFDNEPKKIDWLNADNTKHQPIIFEPKGTFFGKARDVDVNGPQYKTYPHPWQTMGETNACKTLVKMGFDDHHYAGDRFFAPATKELARFDSGFLIKTDKEEYTWYMIDNANMRFGLVWMWKGNVMGGRDNLTKQDLFQLLKRDRLRRLDYLKKQYGK